MFVRGLHLSNSVSSAFLKKDLKFRKVKYVFTGTITGTNICSLLLTQKILNVPVTNRDPFNGIQWNWAFVFPCQVLAKHANLNKNGSVPKPKLEYSISVNNTDLSDVIEPDQTCSVCVCVCWCVDVEGNRGPVFFGPSLNKGPLSGLFLRTDVLMPPLAPGVVTTNQHGF